jgi:transposase
MKATHILGIDIAKCKFDVCLRPAHPSLAHSPRQAAAFDNNRKGFGKLLRWLEKHQAIAVHACLEATSRYGDALALFLHQHGCSISLVNPRRTRHYAASRLVRTQNDPIDAALIADFCASQNPRLWQPAPEDKRQLQDLVRARSFFLDQKQQCLNRLETEVFAFTRQHLRRHIRQLESTMAKLEKQIAALLQQHPVLERQIKLVDSIAGIGLITAAVAVAELPPVNQFRHAGQAVAFAGLDLRQKDSGDSVHTVPRLSKMGPRLLRKTLYMAALCALRKNPIIRALGQRLEAKGKSSKTILCAAMRKLVRLIFGVLKNGQSFDPDWKEPNRAVGLRRPASGGNESSSLQRALPSVATA